MSRTFTEDYGYALESVVSEVYQLTVTLLIGGFADQLPYLKTLPTYSMQLNGLQHLAWV